MFGTDMSKILNSHDMREAARRRMPRWLFENIDRGAEDEVAWRSNRSVFERIKLKQRVLVDVSGRDLSAELFGKKHDLPIGVSPAGGQGLVCYRGEFELTRAAKKANIPYTLSTSATISIETVAREVGGTLWFQLYLWADTSLSYRLVDRAKNNGFEALLVTVDTPVGTNREYNIRNGSESPFRFTRRNALGTLAHPGWLWRVVRPYMRDGGMPVRANYPDDMEEKYSHSHDIKRKTRNDTVTWDEISRLRDRFPGKIVLKGILTPEDAERAVAVGVDGILVSNHGGRNFDSYRSPMEVLGPIADQVNGRIAVIVDSGFRRGSDVVKALALGADFVTVARPMVWGIAVDGEAGAARQIRFYRDEISRALGFLGCTSISSLGREHLDTTRPDF